MEQANADLVNAWEKIHTLSDLVDRLKKENKSLKAALAEAVNEIGVLEQQILMRKKV